MQAGAAHLAHVHAVTLADVFLVSLHPSGDSDDDISDIFNSMFGNRRAAGSGFGAGARSGYGGGFGYGAPRGANQYSRSYPWGYY